MKDLKRGVSPDAIHEMAYKGPYCRAQRQDFESYMAVSRKITGAHHTVPEQN